MTQDYFNGMTAAATVDGLLGPAVVWGSAAAMMFGGVVPYMPQYREIQRSDNADGFSLFVCLALLVANCLRILFWFGHPFELPLLFQSVIMVFAMFMLIHLCVRVKHRTQIIRARDRLFSGDNASCDDGAHRLKGISPRNSAPCTTHSFWGTSIIGLLSLVARPITLRIFLCSFCDHFSCPHETTRSTLTDFDGKYFWAWTDFMSYIECTVTFVTLLGVLTYVLLDNFWFVEGTGFAAVFVEAMLGVPQFCRNHSTQSTDGMSKKMVFMWLCGDIFKTGYFYLRSSPPQFYVCGALQVSVDLAILVQVLAYKGRTKPSTYVS